MRIAKRRFEAVETLLQATAALGLFGALVMAFIAIVMFDDMTPRVMMFRLLPIAIIASVSGAIIAKRRGNHMATLCWLSAAASPGLIAALLLVGSVVA